MQDQKAAGQDQNQTPKTEAEEHRDERIEKTGQLTLSDRVAGKKIHLLTIIGEIEGHDNLSGNSKTTKYEHILPQLAAIEDSEEIGGVLVLLNTMGGDVEAGLAIASFRWIAAVHTCNRSESVGSCWDGKKQLRYPSSGRRIYKRRKTV